MQANHRKGMFNMRRLARFIEFNFSDQHAICLNSRIRKLEVCVAPTIVEEEERKTEGSLRWFSRTRGSAIPL
jgi:hypothetical protein